MLNKEWRLVDTRYNNEMPPLRYHDLDGVVPSTNIRIKVKYQHKAELLECKVMFVDKAKLFYEVCISSYPALAHLHYLRYGDHQRILRTNILEILNNK